MLNGQKTNYLSLASLAGVGGLAMGGGWQMVLTYAPAIIAVLLPFLAMTLHHAIMTAGLQKPAMTVEQVLAAARGMGWGPISAAAGMADDVLVKALENPPVAVTTTTTTAAPAA